MLRRKILAAVTTLALALGMSVGGAGAAFANPNQTEQVRTPNPPSGVEIYNTDTGTFNCNNFAGVAGSNQDRPNGPNGQVSIDQAGTWGTVTATASTVTWNIKAGWTVDVCIKGSTTVVWLDDRFGTGSYNFKKAIKADISHINFGDAQFTPKPPDRTVEGEWEEGEYVCGDTEVQRTRTITTTSSVWRNGQWVDDEPSTTTANDTRPLTPEELAQLDCPVDPEPTLVAGSVSSTPENCLDNNGSIVFEGDEGVVYTFDGDTYFSGDSVTGLAADTYTVAVAAVSDEFELTSSSSVEVTVGSTELDCPVEEPVDAFIEASLIGTECDTDVPFILFNISLADPDGTYDGDGTVSLFFSDGENEHTLVLGQLDENGTLEGRALWPGASITDGVASGWPGWAFENGSWVSVGDDNFGWTRVLDSATIEINPELLVELSYPPATPDCDVDPPFDPPTLPLVEPTVDVALPTCDLAGSFTLSDTDGVVWLVNGRETAAGTYPAVTGSTVNVEAVALLGTGFAFETQTEWSLAFPAPAEECDEEAPPVLTDLPTLALTGASGMLGTLGIVALLITLTGIGVVATRRRVEV